MRYSSEEKKDSAPVKLLTSVEVGFCVIKRSVIILVKHKMLPTHMFANEIDQSNLFMQVQV